MFLLSVLPRCVLPDIDALYRIFRHMGYVVTDITPWWGEWLNKLLCGSASRATGHTCQRCQVF
jgi:hypothetical protein